MLDLTHCLFDLAKTSGAAHNHPGVPGTQHARTTAYTDTAITYHYDSAVCCNHRYQLWRRSRNDQHSTSTHINSIPFAHVAGNKTSRDQRLIATFISSSCMPKDTSTTHIITPPFNYLSARNEDTINVFFQPALRRHLCQQRPDKITGISLLIRAPPTVQISVTWRSQRSGCLWVYLYTRVSSPIRKECASVCFSQ